MYYCTCTIGIKLMQSWYFYRVLIFRWIVYIVIQQTGGVAGHRPPVRTCRWTAADSWFIQGNQAVTITVNCWLCRNCVIMLILTVSAVPTISYWNVKFQQFLHTHINAHLVVESLFSMVASHRRRGRQLFASRGFKIDRSGKRIWVPKT